MSSEKYAPSDYQSDPEPPPYPTQPAPYPAQTESYATQPTPYPAQTEPYPTQQPPYPAQTQPATYPAQIPQYGGQQSYVNTGYTGGYTTGQTTIVTQPQVVMGNYPGVRPDPTSQLIFSCVVIWCCFCCLGLPAFILAILSGSDHDIQEARRKLRIANYLNIAGVVVGVCITITWVALVIASAAASAANH